MQPFLQNAPHRFRKKNLATWFAIETQKDEARHHQNRFFDEIEHKRKRNKKLYANNTNGICAHNGKKIELAKVFHRYNQTIAKG